jgi:hypothetical protein
MEGRQVDRTVESNGERAERLLRGSPGLIVQAWSGFSNGRGSFRPPLIWPGKVSRTGLLVCTTNGRYLSVKTMATLARGSLTRSNTSSARTTWPLSLYAQVSWFARKDPGQPGYCISGIDGARRGSHPCRSRRNHGRRHTDTHAGKHFCAFIAKVQLSVPCHECSITTSNMTSASMSSS